MPKILTCVFTIGAFVIGRSDCFADSPDWNRARQSESLKHDVGYLASEELRGRSVADDSIDVAANFVAGRMKSVGLDVTTINGTAFQPVKIQLDAKPGGSANNVVRFRFNGDVTSSADIDITAELGQDMTPMSAGSTSAAVQAPLAFVGYGITAPALNYDDYAGINVSGHVVVILRKEPQLSDPKSPFEGVKNSRHAYFPVKIQNAIENGASAILFVNDAASAKREVQQMQTRIDGELTRRAQLLEQRNTLPTEAVNNRKTLAGKVEGIDLMVSSMQVKLKSKQRGLMDIAAAGNSAPSQDTVPIVSITRDTLDRLLQRSMGKSLEAIEASIDGDLVPQSRLLDQVMVDLRCEISPSNRISNNVIGVLAGRGFLSEETVIVGAHYDHVGMGGTGSLSPGIVAIHNGADDNASGTAAMLAAAKQVVSRLSAESEHRRIVFIAFTGEERGLLGSKHYVRQPRFPLESTVTMINLDMVGRLRENDLTVYGTGSGDAIDSVLESANESMENRGGKFNLFKVTTGYGPSDHQSFYEAKVPVLFFFTGLHNDYHRPSDDFDKIDFGGLTRITDIVTESCFLLAVRPRRPRYTATEKKFKMRWQKTAILGISLSAARETIDQTVIVASVSKDGPADRGGIRVGDQLIQIGRRQIERSKDVLESMRGRRPGETLKLQVMRAGRLFVFNVVLAANEPVSR